MFLTCTMQGGGAERVIANLSNYLILHDYEVGILATGGNIVDYNISEKVVYKYTNPRNEIPVIKQIFKMIDNYKKVKEFKPDVVVTFLPTPCIYAAIIKSVYPRFKLIISERMDPSQDPHNWILRKLRDLAYNFGDGYIFQTYDAKNYFNKKIQNKSKIILNPLKEGIPYKSEKEKNKIVTVARLEPQKNVLLLIKAFEIIKSKNYTLHIYGIGSEEKNLRNYVNTNEIKNIFFEGFRKDVHEQISDAQIFVLPSNYEGLSNAMLEAMAMGIPLITTDHPAGGPRMLIENNINGIIVELDNPVEMAKEMDRLLSSKELRVFLSRNERKIREICAKDAIYQEWEQYINKIYRNIKS